MKKIFYFIMCLMTLSFVACKHVCPEPEVKLFDIKVSDVTANSASVTITPTNENEVYYFDLLDKETFMSYTSAEFLEAEPDYFEQIIAYYADYGYSITWNDLVSTGEDSYEFTNLASETDYVVVAFTVDPVNKTVGNTIEFAEFTTLAVEMSDMSFEFVMNDTALFIIPSDQDAHYFLIYAEHDTLTAYNYTIESYASTAFTYYSENYGPYFEEYFTYTGTVYCPFESLPEASDFAVCGTDGTTQVTDWFYYAYEPVATLAAPRRVVTKGNLINHGNLVKKNNFIK